MRQVIVKEKISDRNGWFKLYVFSVVFVESTNITMRNGINLMKDQRLLQHDTVENRWFEIQIKYENMRE